MIKKLMERLLWRGPMQTVPEDPEPVPVENKAL
jgi:hypothetical protein